MAQTTVYTCDICKQSKSKNDLAKMIVRVEGLTIKGFVDGHGLLNIDVCPDCLKRKGFVVEPKDEELEQASAQNKATLEDKIYEILEELGVMFTE